MDPCSVFVDSNYFIAFFNPADALHSRALVSAKKLYAEDVNFVISNFIFLEVVTVLSQRVGKQSALRVGSHLLDDPKLSIIHIDPSLQQTAWQIFQTVPAKDIGFVDCSILAVMRAEAIHLLLTFDKTDFRPLLKNFHFAFYDDSPTHYV